MASHSSILIWKIPWTEELADYSPWDCKESDATEHTYLFSDWETNYLYFRLFDIAPQFLNAVFYFFLFCLFSFLFLLTWSVNFICMFTYSFFVCVSSAVEHGVFLLLLSISIWFLITVNTSLVKLSICSCILSTFSIKSF